MDGHFLKCNNCGNFFRVLQEANGKINILKYCDKCKRRQDGQSMFGSYTIKINGVPI